MANATVGLEACLGVTTPRGVADVAFRMRGNGARRLYGSRFVTVAAIQFPTIRQGVLIHVVHVLLAIEVGVVIAPRREITLWRERDEFLAMTDDAGLTRRKMRGVALNTGIVARKNHQ